MRLALARLDETEEPSKYRADGPLLTYFIKCGDAVKIGRTRNVSARLCDLQTSNSTQLELLGVTFESEDAMHSRFARYRLRGEWFTLSPEIEAYCAQLDKV